MTLFSGCARNNLSTTPNTLSPENSKTSSSSPEPADKQTPAFMHDIQKLCDEELLYEYINGLEICLIGENELIFKNPDEISSSTLHMFFLYILNNDFFTGDDSQYKEYERQWLKKDNKFHIPIKDITTVLDRYFEHYSLEPAKIYGYSPSENAVIERTITGFGGDVWTRVKDKKFEQEQLVLVVDFYEDNSFQEVSKTKEYVIRFYESGYYLLSVTKK